jgi:hypothetical protein
MARLGTFQPKVPDYAGAFQAIGPAAIKLGQTLATRPTLSARKLRQTCCCCRTACRRCPLQQSARDRNQLRQTD